MPPRAFVVLAAALALGTTPVLTFEAGAQDGRLPSGPIFVPQDGLNVTANSTLRVGPNTSFAGPGKIHVLPGGAFVVEGSAAGPVRFTVPVVVFGGGDAALRHAHLLTVKDTALSVTDATLALSDVRFEGNERALLVVGAAEVRAERVGFEDHAEEAVRIEGRADVLVSNSTFRANGRSVTVYSAERFHVNDSTFDDNGEHLVVDLGPWSTAGDILLARNRFGPPTATPAQLPGILLRHHSPLAQEAPGGTVSLDSNRIEGAPVGLRAEGRGLLVLSSNDTLVDNAIGLSVQLATVRVQGGTFGNERNVDGSGRVTLDDVAYLRADGFAPAPRSSGEWVPWALAGAAVALVAAGALAYRRVQPRPRSVPVEAPPPPPPPQPRVDLAAPISSVERRILEDILAHPGTAQRAVAERLGSSRQALHYHVKKLEARGLVVKAVEGRETRCTVPPVVAALLSGDNATRTGTLEKG